MMLRDRPTILVIDDELINIEIVGQTLEDDFEVIFAIHGKDGIQVARDTLPDLILLDVIMPDINGYEVCANLKADPRTVAIPIIFITALGTAEQEVQGLEAGAIDYVTKPINPFVLRARVRNHLELKRAQKLLEDLAATDGLTGVANRRFFDSRLEAEYERLKRSFLRLSIIMIDIDNFKTFNDTYGHLAGDDCLKNIARVIHRFTRRPADLGARYGGEEFVCMLPEVDQAGAFAVAENIRLGVEALNVMHPDSGNRVYVTVSLGVATILCNAESTTNRLLAMADEALYEAKATGRNRSMSKEL